MTVCTAPSLSAGCRRCRTASAPAAASSASAASPPRRSARRRTHAGSHAPGRRRRVRRLGPRLEAHLGRGRASLHGHDADTPQALRPPRRTLAAERPGHRSARGTGLHVAPQALRPAAPGARLLRRSAHASRCARRSLVPYGHRHLRARRHAGLRDRDGYGERQRLARRRPVRPHDLRVLARRRQRPGRAVGHRPSHRRRPRPRAVGARPSQRALRPQLRQPAQAWRDRSVQRPDASGRPRSARRARRPTCQVGRAPRGRSRWSSRPTTRRRSPCPLRGAASRSRRAC